MSLPSELHYSKTHHWVRNEGSDLRIGLTAFGQEELGDIVFVELPELNEVIEKGESFGSLESDKTVSEIYAPVSGTVVEVNSELESNPELINESPYQKAWMIVIEASDEDELDSLLSADEYQAHID
ncbi:MAG TPA: glycine cleavage system protein GcvH [Pseudogracilibacillus sp.]|nr:glycine cleavage system protein GcvH [Pseudogracilibacillus sp.]